MSAESRVFALPELLEAILLHLPLVDILLAQRVDRTFRDGIKASPALQKALFLRPDDDYSLQLIGTMPISEDCVSHLHCEIDKNVFKAQNQIPPLWVRKTTIDLGKLCGAVLNPFLTFISPDSDCREVGIQATWCHEADASWRKMLLSQPPVQNIFVHTYRAIHWHIMSADQGSSGVTLTNLQRTYDAFRVEPDPGMLLFQTENFETMPKDSTAKEILEGIQDAIGPDSKGTEFDLEAYEGQKIGADDDEDGLD